jgi:hypothetical protein
MAACPNILQYLPASFTQAFTQHNGFCEPANAKIKKPQPFRKTCFVYLIKLKIKMAPAYCNA